MIRYFVRTTAERKLDKSYSQIDYNLLIDTEHKPIESFIHQLKYLSTVCTDVVLIEDDLILCEEFTNKIENAIKQYPDKIINFFCNYDTYFKTRESNEYSSNCCTYYPKRILSILADTMPKYIKYSTQYSWIENLALQELKETHIQYRPCLVQHLDFDTLIQKGNHKLRRTLYFIDYLKELDISYEDASTPENQQKLKELMESKFQNYNGT